MDPIDSLRAGCRALVARSDLVHLDEDAIAAVVVPEALRALPPWDDPAFAAVSDARAVAWLVAYNAINFCYWPDRGPRWFVAIDGVEVGRDDEALAVMALLARAPVDDPGWLETVDVGALLAPAPGAGALPMLAERERALRELGAAIRAHGPPASWLATSAVETTLRLAERLVSWDDRRGDLRFLKRAQLCVAMIHGKLGGAPFSDVERLTAFADYRLPQILRGLGVLRLDPELAEAVERGDELPAGSPAEVALRAAAVDGAERLTEATGLSSLVIDHFLWRTAVARQAQLPPHHRTRCTDY
jgi:hypothetical protein